MRSYKLRNLLNINILPPPIICRVIVLLLAVVAIAAACSNEYPEETPLSLDTRSVGDSTVTDSTANKLTITVDTTWADTLRYDFDGNPIITIPDSVPQGDAGNAV